MATRTSAVTDPPRLDLGTLAEDIRDVDAIISVFGGDAADHDTAPDLLRRWLTDERPCDIDDVAAILDIQPAMVRRLASNHRKAVADGRALDSRCLIAPVGFETYATNQVIVFGWLTGRLHRGTLTPVAVIEEDPGPGEYLDDLDRMLHTELEALIGEYSLAAALGDHGTTAEQIRGWLTDSTLCGYKPIAALYGVGVPTIRKRVNAYRNNVRAGLPPDRACFIRPDLSEGTNVREWAWNRAVLHGWRVGWLVPGTLVPIIPKPPGRPAA